MSEARDLYYKMVKPLLSNTSSSANMADEYIQELEHELKIKNTALTSMAMKAELNKRRNE